MMIAKFVYSFAWGNLAPLHTRCDNPTIHNHIVFSTNLRFICCTWQIHSGD